MKMNKPPTNTHIQMRVSTTFDLCVKDGRTDRQTDIQTANGRTKPLIDLSCRAKDEYNEEENKWRTR